MSRRQCGATWEDTRLTGELLANKIDANKAKRCRQILPVSLASTLFLDLLGVGVDKASFGKELWDMLSRSGVVGVVTISELVATSHWRHRKSAQSKQALPMQSDGASIKGAISVKVIEMISDGYGPIEDVDVRLV